MLLTQKLVFHLQMCIRYVLCHVLAMLLGMYQVLGFNYFVRVHRKGFSGGGVSWQFPFLIVVKGS